MNINEYQRQAKRVRFWFGMITFAMLGAGFVAGYLWAVVVRECDFNLGCVAQVFWA